MSREMSEVTRRDALFAASAFVTSFVLSSCSRTEPEINGDPSTAKTHGHQSEVLGINGPEPKNEARNFTQTGEIKLNPEKPFRSQILGLSVPYHRVPALATSTKLQERLLACGINSIVIDIKNEVGRVNVSFEHPLRTPPSNESVDNPEFVHQVLSWAKSKGIYMTARQVVMTDNLLAAKAPSTMFRTFDNHPIISKADKSCWLNPEDPDVASYNAAITKAASEIGFNEILFDYIRYPNALTGVPEETMVNSINRILKEAHDNLINTQTRLGACVFVDTVRLPITITNTEVGQKVSELWQFVDLICPMTYPHLRPSDPVGADPYQFVYESCLGARELLEQAGTNILVNPWIQGYEPLGSYDINQQMRGAFDAGAAGVYTWDPAMNYPSDMYGRAKP